MSEAGPKTRSPWAWIPTLYLAEGLPYVVVMTVSVILYKNLGLSNADIALYTSWLYLPWVIKPLWSPVVDLLGTRRRWIWATQLVVAAALAGVALSLPGPHFVRWTLVFFWLLAFDSATHDIAADGFYMLAITEKEQSFFVGVRTLFYRVATIAGQGLLVMLAGTIQSHTGLARVELPVRAEPGAAWVRTVAPESSRFAPEVGVLRMVMEPPAVAISPEPRPRHEVDSLVASARAWNVARELRSASAHVAGRRPSRWSRHVAVPVGGAWSRHVATPLADALRRRFGREPVAAGTSGGNLGLARLRLSRPPGHEVVVTLAFRSGRRDVVLAEGSRLRFDDRNWDQPALVVLALDPKLRTATAARFEARAGDIPLSWAVAMATLAALFLLFGAWHRFALPRPAADRPGDVRRVPVFVREFLGTFGAYFRKPRIVVLLLFLLLYRFGEAQLVKMAGPFLLDAREQGGLALTTTQFGLVYGTVGIAALTLGGVLGGWAVSRHGLKAWLWPMLLAIHLPDVAFLYLAQTQPASLATIQACVAVEQFGYGFGLSAYLLYMIRIARGPHATAHYAICTGFMALGMMLPGMWSGWLADLVGYRHFFAWVILATVPSFVVAMFIPLERDFGRKGAA